MTDRNVLLAGKTALVTGAGSGIGRAVARLFHAAGAAVAVADRNGPAAEAVAAALGDGRALAITADVTQVAEVAAMTEAAAARFGGLDVLVNCAGIPQLVTPIEAMTEAEWDRIMAVNLRATFLTCRAAVPYLKRAGGGAIVNIASIVGVRPKPGIGAYCASKAGLAAFGQSLALELAASGIRVNTINPGAAETPMLGGFLPPGANLEAGRKAFAGAIPLGRLVAPEDVAEAALYLASPGAGMVTGVSLNVDGGRGV